MEETKKRVIFWAVLACIAGFLIIWTAIGNMESPFSSQRALGMWITAFFSLCILSFLYDDNPIYKFAESVFVGVSAAYWMAEAIWEQLIKNLLTKTLPEVATLLVRDVEPVSIGIRLWFLVPLVMGIMLLMRLSSKGGWISRWPLAFIVGWTAGMNLVRYLESDFVNQVSYSFLPLIVLADAGGMNWYETFCNIVLVTGTLAGLIYFYFSVEHKGLFGKVSKVGIWVLMITFGAAFGYTVMGRITLLIGRMEFLFADWMRIIQF